MNINLSQNREKHQSFHLIDPDSLHEALYGSRQINISTTRMPQTSKKHIQNN